MFLLPSLTVPRADILKARYTKYMFQNKTLPHAITTHQLTIQALQATKSAFLSLLLLFASYRITLSVSASPSPIGSQQNVPMVAHSAPRFPTFNRSTQALRKDHNPSSTVCQHTPAPPFPHPQLLLFCKSQLICDPPPPLFLHANFMAIRE